MECVRAHSQHLLSVAGCSTLLADMAACSTLPAVMVGFFPFGWQTSCNSMARAPMLRRGALAVQEKAAGEGLQNTVAVCACVFARVCVHAGMRACVFLCVCLHVYVCVSVRVRGGGSAWE